MANKRLKRLITQEDFNNLKIETCGIPVKVLLLQDAKSYAAGKRDAAWEIFGEIEKIRHSYNNENNYYAWIIEVEDYEVLKYKYLEVK